MVLKVTNFGPQNVGKYLCKSSNNIGSDSKEISIKIQMAPIVEVVPSAVEVVEGKTVNFECKVSNAEGDYTILWTDESKLAQRKVNLEIKLSKISEIIIFISFFIQHQEGATFSFIAHKSQNNKKITCEVKNGEFIVSSSSFVTVLYAPEFKYGQKNTPVNRQLKFGVNFVLNSEADENPIATSVTWSYKAKNTEKFVTLHDTSRVLRFQKLTPELEGRYECLVRNSVGRSNKIMDVRISPASESTLLEVFNFQYL